MKVVMENGYVITDSSDLTLADFEDAVTGYDEPECCPSKFEGWVCTRKLAHTGPHMAATSGDSVTALWESNSIQ